MRIDAPVRKRSPLLRPRPSGRAAEAGDSKRLRQWVAGLLIAALAVMLAGLSRHILSPWVGSKSIFMLFYPAIILSAWFGRLFGGLTAVMLSAGTVLVAFGPGAGGIDLTSPGEAGTLALFIAVSSSLAWGSSTLRQTFRDLERAGEAMTEKESRFQALFDILPVGISIAQDAACTDIRHNPTFAQWLGHPVDINASLTGPQAQQLPYRVMQHGKEVKPEDLPMPVAARTGKPYRDWEGEVVTRDGRVIHILGYATPLFGADGNVEGCLGTYVDITEVRRAEQERAKYQAEVETLNKQLQRAVSETHHRVKNNLQVITALLNLEIMRHHASVPAANVERIIHHVQSLAVIHDMLTYQSKESALNQRVSSRQAIEKLVPLVAGLVSGRRIHYTADHVDLTPRQASALAILVNELIGNAIKHSHGDIDVRFAAASMCARLEVTDEGPGFPAGFEPSQSANTGLELVETVSRWDLQGDTRYENREEGGAKVVVEFPV